MSNPFYRKPRPVNGLIIWRIFPLYLEPAANYNLQEITQRYKRLRLKTYCYGLSTGWMWHKALRTWHGFLEARLLPSMALHKQRSRHFVAH
jgi:hypothetical protein